MRNFIFTLIAAQAISTHAQDLSAAKEDDPNPDSFYDRVVTPAPFNPAKRFSEFAVVRHDADSNVLIASLPETRHVERNIICPVVKYTIETRHRTVPKEGKSTTVPYQVEVPHTFAYSKLYSYKESTGKTVRAGYKMYRAFRLDGELLSSDEAISALNASTSVLFAKDAKLAMPAIPVHVRDILRSDALVVVVDPRSESSLQSRDKSGR